mmetsp:Transcript_50341/g.133671  ORF Transcript_50341/g.133671 Transcript_50341/m.133671 type:complete len:104 (+) Transcript_50341:1848-2159(+)
MVVGTAEVVATAGLAGTDRERLSNAGNGFEVADKEVLAMPKHVAAGCGTNDVVVGNALVVCESGYARDADAACGLEWGNEGGRPLGENSGFAAGARPKPLDSQ